MASYTCTSDRNNYLQKLAYGNGDSVQYTYDANNQLTKAAGAKTYTYTYDNAGNITKAVKDGETHTYTYGNTVWGDLLTAYNGSSITYDAIGNPTEYYNGWNFTWEHGREMATATNGSTTLSFKYDANGLRTSKTVGEVEHSYFYYGGKLIRETYGSNILNFYYDASGVPYMLEYNGTVYYYVTNAQGDVIQLVNDSGTAVAKYEYDPYGATVDASSDSTTEDLTAINPLRYRGYVYDTESGLYYLQSRYYDPNTGRFLNADALISTGQGLLGNNMFAYCSNNPASCYDPSGTATISVCNGDRNPLFVGYIGLGGGATGGGFGGSVGDGTKSSRQKAQDIVLREVTYLLNSDAQTVLDAQYIAFYKGCIMVKASIKDYEDCGFSLGVVVLGNEVNSVDTVKHEYGHFVHMRQIGMPAYLFTAVIPSVIGFWSDVGYDDYYSQPWEYVADYLGGVTRDKGDYVYASGAPEEAAIYWVYTWIVGGV